MSGTTANQLQAFFTSDHRRLEALLDRAAADPSAFDMEAYGAFRAGLLKHISMEEKILLPAAQKHNGGSPIALAAKLRLDHGAIAALLVPPPSRTIIAALRSILELHDVLEESPGGVYDVCAQLVGDELEEVMAQLRAARDVPPNPYNANPLVLDATRRALARAGYDLSDYEEKPDTIAGSD